MTKNSLDLWSQSLLNKHEIFPFINRLKAILIMKKSSFSKLVLPCNLTNVNEKAAYSKIYYLVTILTNIQIMYILGMVIPTKVDTSQFPQQNIN